jgi:hypothetical protein
VNYSSSEQINELGIPLFKGNKIYEQSIVLDNDNYFPIVHAPFFNYNLNPNIHYFQTKEISQLIHDYLHSNKDQIIHKNPFQERYNSNNDIYIHVRLGDVAQWNPGSKYYMAAISKLEFDNLYLSTDDCNHDIIKNIQSAYPQIKFIKYDEVKTIQFASTCKHIILSHGTFSYMIGHLSFFSKVYYPKWQSHNYKAWVDDMFIDEWTKIEDF